MLPELRDDPRIPGSLLGTLRHEEREVSLRLTPDDASTERCRAAAKQAVAALPELHRRARDVAARALLANYNENWRHYTRMAEDGATVEVHDPELEPAEFKARLRLTCLEVMGTDSYTLFYDDDRMFAGHAVVVNSFDGLRFSDASAELFG